MGAINQTAGIKGEVCAVLTHEDREHASDCPYDGKPRSCACGKVEVSVWHNIITNAGDQFYAEAASKGITASPASLTDDFDTMSVATAVTTACGTKTADGGDITTVPTGGTKAIDSGYPQLNDPDTNNPGTTGADILTWRTTYSTSQANGTLVGLAIHESGTTLGSGTDPILMSVDLSPSITKTSGMSLAFFVNHNFLGS